MRKHIFDRISDITGIPVDKIPRRFEVLGSAILMNMKGIPDDTKFKIAKAFVSQFRLRSFYEIIEIKGKMRVPSVRLIYGINADTIHFENGIAFTIDPSKVMFSKGNKYERHRLVGLANADETVVDMFAGIGYFSIPISMKVAKVYACEINPVSFHYLLLNKRLNNSKNLIPFYGNSLDFPFKNIANRVIMGHFDSFAYLNKALDILKHEGTIHFHTLSKRADNATFNYLNSLEYVRNIEKRVVKSYSPSAEHVVFDLYIEKK